jgi:hypothetical protein
MARNFIMIRVKVIQGYYCIRMMEFYKVHHPKVLEDSDKVKLEHGCLSGGSGQFGILAEIVEWPSGTWLEQVQIREQWCTDEQIDSAQSCRDLEGFK